MRNRTLKIAVIAALAGFFGAQSIEAAANLNSDWPLWRGPTMTGEAPQADPPATWSESENIKWKVASPGEGHATPIVLGNRLFIQAALGSTGPRPSGPLEFSLVCLDRQSGKTTWKKAAKSAVPHEGRHQTGSFASGSPATDGESVFAFFGSEGIYCFDLDGNLKWSKDLGDMQIKNQFGEGSSPALHGDTVVVNWDHEGADFIVALDKRNGNERWRTPREEGTSWSTPLIVEHGGKAQVITTATARVRSYDLETGKEIWNHAGLTANAIPTAVAANDVVYTTSGFRGAALYAIKLGGMGDLTDTPSVLWKHAKNTPYVPSPLLVGNRLYFLSGNNAMLSIFDVISGKPLVDAERLQGLAGIYASPVAAAGKIYIASQNGSTLVLKDSDKIEVLATNTLDDRFDASPAIVGKEIFLRGAKNIYCIAAK